MSFTKVVKLDDGTVVLLRDAKPDDIGTGSWDVTELADLRERLAPNMRDDVPLRNTGMAHGQVKWKLEPGSRVAVVSGHVIAAGVARPIRAGAELVVVIDPGWAPGGVRVPRSARGVEDHLAESLFDDAQQKHHRRLVTREVTVAERLGGFRRGPDGRFERWLLPWLRWETTEIGARRTLVIARPAVGLASPTASDVGTVPADADGVQVSLVLTRDGPTVFDPASARDPDLRRSGLLARLTREEIGLRTGSVPLSLEQIIEDTEGRAIIVKFADEAVAGPAVDVLNRADALDVVLAMSSHPEAVHAASEAGLRAALLLGLGRLLLTGDPALEDLLEQTGAEFAAVGEPLRRTGILNSWPAWVLTAEADDEIADALRRRRVHALLTTRTGRAYELRDELGDQKKGFR